MYSKARQKSVNNDNSPTSNTPEIILIPPDTQLKPQSFGSTARISGFAARNGKCVVTRFCWIFFLVICSLLWTLLFSLVTLSFYKQIRWILQFALWIHKCLFKSIQDTVPWKTPNKNRYPQRSFLVWWTSGCSVHVPRDHFGWLHPHALRLERSRESTGPCGPTRKKQLGGGFHPIEKYKEYSTPPPRQWQ